MIKIRDFMTFIRICETYCVSEVFESIQVGSFLNNSRDETLRICCNL